MSKMPIDVKQLLDSVANIGQERDLPVYVDLVFDPTASDTLIDYIIDAFVGRGSTAIVESVVLGTSVPRLPLPADLCVIVGGDSLLLGDVAAAARAKGIPSVVAIARGETFFADNPEAAQRLADETLKANTVPTPAATASAPAVGKGIPMDDIVDIDVKPGTRRPLEELGSWIVSNAPAKRIVMAANFAFLRHPLAVELTQHNAIENGAIGLVFFMPGADMPLITLNQARMVLQIAAVYGNDLSTDRIKEVAAVVAGGFGCRALARKLVSLVPVMGWAIKPAVAASGTVAMGYCAIGYYEGNVALASPKEAVDDLFDVLADLADNGTTAVENAVDGVTMLRMRVKSPSANN